jgi:hypothetical protein
MRLITALIALIVLSILSLAQVKEVSANTTLTDQIKLIETAAPPDVVKDATIYILAKSGYQKHRLGKNGFSCLVLRERRDTVEPECYDAEGSATLLQADLYLEAERAKGGRIPPSRPRSTRDTRPGGSKRHARRASFTCCRHIIACTTRMQNRSSIFPVT